MSKTGKMYTEMLRRDTSFRQLIKSRELRKIANDVGLHPISMGWALFKGVGDVAVGNVMKNRKLSYEKEMIKNSFEEGIANKEQIADNLKMDVAEMQYLIDKNNAEINEKIEKVKKEAKKISPG